MISLFCALLIAGSVGFLAYLIVEEMEKEKLRFQYFSLKKSSTEESLFLTLNRPAIQKMARKIKTPPPAIQKMIQESGFKEVLNGSEWIAWMVIMGLEFGLIFMFLFGPGILKCVLGFLVGGSYPYFWLRSERSNRLGRIKKDLPLVIDLLAILVSAGMDIFQALKRIEELLPKNDLISELSQMLEEVGLGKTRKEALQSFKKRIPILEVRSLVSMLTQTLQLGSPLAPVLIANADQMRSQRFMEAERLGVKAAQKILCHLFFAFFLRFLSPFFPL